MGVPTYVSRILFSLSSLDKPKSVTLIWPLLFFRSRSKFSSFKSLWQTFFLKSHIIKDGKTTINWWWNKPVEVLYGNADLIELELCNLFFQSFFSTILLDLIKQLSTFRELHHNVNTWRSFDQVKDLNRMCNKILWKSYLEKAMNRTFIIPGWSKPLRMLTSFMRSEGAEYFVGHLSLLMILTATFPPSFLLQASCTTQVDPSPTIDPIRYSSHRAEGNF